jgi:nicotinamide riboside transporter PnuC
MSTTLIRGPKRVLEPVERISEFLFGLIMVLTLTCTFNAGEANRSSVRTMLVEALGCNVAWGIIDAFFYLLNCLGQRGHGIALLKKLRRTSDPGEARQIVADELPPLVASLLEPQEIESLTGKLTQIPESTVGARLAKEDWLGALGVFLLVFLSLFPVVVPFIFAGNAHQATRISNGIAIVLLFLAGYSFGRFTNSNPWRAGLAMVIFGIAVVSVAILLGG